MPAVFTDPLTLPRITAPDPAVTAWRPVERVVTAFRTLEGEGFEVRRPFPGAINFIEADPFLLFDHMGGSELAPFEAKGAPDHPHRGFETVTYMIDGQIEHRDSAGGGGIIFGGDTQWMTAGGGIVHSEMPTHEIYVNGGVMHGVQLWVNLPRSEKLVTPRYQDLTGEGLTQLSSEDGSSLLRVIAGELDGHSGPGQTYTPITYVHASVAPGAELRLGWRSDFNALAYALLGEGSAGIKGVPLAEGQMVVFGPGDGVVLRAKDRQPVAADYFEVLLLGGLPIREPIAHYGPFVMNTREEILQAIEDYQSGRMGSIPAQPSS